MSSLGKRSHEEMSEDKVASDDSFEYEETHWDSGEEDEGEEALAAPAQPHAATGTMRDGRRFAAFFCSPDIKPLKYLAEALGCSLDTTDTGKNTIVTKLLEAFKATKVAKASDTFSAST